MAAIAPEDVWQRLQYLNSYGGGMLASGTLECNRWGDTELKSPVDSAMGEGLIAELPDLVGTVSGTPEEANYASSRAKVAGPELTRGGLYVRHLCSGNLR